MATPNSHLNSQNERNREAALWANCCFSVETFDKSFIFELGKTFSMSPCHARLVYMRPDLV